MKLLFIIVNLLISGTCVAQNFITIGKKDTLYSKTLNENRELWIHVPAPDPVYAKQHYPVVYLLDGNAHFNSVVGMIHHFSMISGNTVTPPMIVVGIVNTNRSRDLTPSLPAGEKTGSAGGAEQFTKFIKNELIPYIDSVYPTTNYKTLIGHSLGGLMVINTLLKHAELFNSYIAVDPSLWWDNKKFLNEAKLAFASNNLQGKSLFVGIANTMPAGLDTNLVKYDTARKTLHIRSILEFVNGLKNNTRNHLRFDYKYYNEDDHSSVPVITEYDGLHFTFKDFRFKNSNRLYDSTYNADSALSAHFTQASKLMGYHVLPDEKFINELAYFYLEAKNYKKAFLYFKMNIDNYPKSFNAFDGMGDYYVELKDLNNAKTSFEKALQIKEYPDTRKKYNDLLKAK